MKEFVIRGKTASGLTHTINFAGHKGDYGFRLIEFQVFPSVAVGDTSHKLTGSVTAAKEAQDSLNPDFNSEGLIGSTMLNEGNSVDDGPVWATVINDTFIITQDILLHFEDRGGGSYAVNWQCKFMPVKLTTTEAALTNYRQFSIFDE